jgi:hypothetical protein
VRNDGLAFMQNSNIRSREIMPYWQHCCHAPAHSKAVLPPRANSCVKSIGKSTRLNDNSLLIIFTLSNITSKAIALQSLRFSLQINKFCLKTLIPLQICNKRILVSHRSSNGGRSPLAILSYRLLMTWSRMHPRDVSQTT